MSKCSKFSISHTYLSQTMGKYMQLMFQVLFFISEILPVT